MNIFLKDVLDQPNSLRKSLETLISSSCIKIMNEINVQEYEKIIFSGMGSSHFCNCAASTFLNQNGYISTVISTSQLLHYEINSINRKTLLVLVSQSGESAEIVKLIEKIPNNITVIAITNNVNSSLGKRGNFVFLLNVPDEEAVSTRTYLSSLIISNLLAKALVGQLNDDFINDVNTSLDNLENFLTSYTETGYLIKNFIQAPTYCCIIGRGYSLPSVHAGALFIRELAKYPSIDFESAEFRHGPFEMVNNGFLAMIFAPDGETYNLNIGLAENIAKHHGKAILVTNRKPQTTNENILVIEQKPCSEFLAPINEIAPLQLLANCLAEAKNLEVGTFLHSSKITKVE
ncbi:SIS domain-containing protein [Clostridium bowmanii]|uniref:SIS domain-containing protein n=1 Tax=Clostridium bowmanii TaxID=132925 RepID=UPI001C0D7CEF|nr:SIS domain-containing protein [Clostridium bowmanii]MBU3191026.1 SIS domain-containing protein [Clostridium bowmanii]MCA1075349.1 SIS domain-containing protein [Clostridium bowmanii]